MENCNRRFKQHHCRKFARRDLPDTPPQNHLVKEILDEHIAKKLA
jgi:hypothetical protein